VLRSKSPELVRQEFWGLLLAHFAVCQRRREDTSACRSKTASRGMQSGPRRTPRFNLVDQPAFLP
jgi:hypothetical protein